MHYECEYSFCSPCFYEWSTRKLSRFMTLSRTRPPGLCDAKGMQSCADNSLSLGGGLPRRSITETRVDTSIPLSDKDGLRGWHCRPEKCRYQHRAIPFSPVVEEPVFSSRRPAVCIMSQIEWNSYVKASIVKKRWY